MRKNLFREKDNLICLFSMFEWMKGQRVICYRIRDYFLGFTFEIIAEDVNGLNFKEFNFTSFNLKEFEEQVEMLRKRFFT